MRAMPSTDPAGSTLSTFASFRRLLPYVRPALAQLTGGLLSALGASLAALAIPHVLQYVVDGPLTEGLATHDWSGLAWSVVLIALFGLAEAGLVALRRSLVMFPGTRVEHHMRMAMFRHLQDLPAAFHDKWPGGQLLSRVMSDLSLLRRWLIFGLLQLVLNICTIAVGVGVLVATAGWLGLVYLAGAIPVVVIVFRFARRYRVISRRSQDQSGDLATTVEESVHGIRVLKAFGRGHDALHSFTGQADRLRRTELRKASVDAGLITTLTLIPEVTLGICLVLGAWLTGTGQMSVGALVLFFATTAVVNGPVVDLGMTLSMTLNARTAVDRYFEVMETVPDLADPTTGAVTLPEDASGHVALRDVSFTFPAAPESAGSEPAGSRTASSSRSPSGSEDGTPGSRDVLRGVDLDLPPGTTTALVGLTGAGKSTLALLVPRIYDVTAGQVLLDGVDVRDLTRHDVRRHVAVAFEDPTLFSASVAENVLLGVPEDGPHAVPGPERTRRLHEAIEVAQADFVHDLPHGVDTRIGEEGLSLSGGQRQRLALARAIAAKPSVLVLDDPLSALDVTTEEAVTRRLTDVLAGTTTLVIAHRPSTVALADRVAVLADGRVTDVGPHSELLATSARYRHIISSLEHDHDHATEHQPAHDQEVNA